MAAVRSLLHEDNFHCSICIAVFTKPVSLPCGHNYCMACITGYWDTQETLFHCPLCKAEFHIRPQLRVNHIMADMAEKFKNPVQEKSAVAANGTVLCGVCNEQKSAALKSCLVCLVSYCETHLKPHMTIVALKKHKLISAVENPESRLCRTHCEPLELFCLLDRMFICSSCKNSDHKAHKTVTVEEEAQRRKQELSKDRNDKDLMVREREQKIQEIRNSMQASRNNAAKALAFSSHVMIAVVDYIQKCQAELREVTEAKQKKNKTAAEGFIKDLEREIMQINQTSAQLEQVALTNDPFVFLESFLSLPVTVPEVKEWSDVTLNDDPFMVQEAIAKLQTMVTREISALCDPDLKEKQKYAVDVTLDPDTANPYLNVSEDGKQVSHEDRRKNVPSKPERFDHVLNVLAKEGFCRGKFYYEVQVKDKTQWDLGVASQTINRKGDIRLSPRSGYWTIWLRKGCEFTANAGPAISLQVREIPQKVGVFVDCDEGKVSFYNVDTRAKIFSFTECNFTEKIFPFFSPCSNDAGKNAAPLIITPFNASC